MDAFKGLKTIMDFNPRLREGGDELSQSSQPINYENFNPRLREGGDALLSGAKKA